MFRESLYLPHSAARAIPHPEHEWVPAVYPLAIALCVGIGYMTAATDMPANFDPGTTFHMPGGIGMRYVPDTTIRAPSAGQLHHVAALHRKQGVDPAGGRQDSIAPMPTTLVPGAWTLHMNDHEKAIFRSAVDTSPALAQQVFRDFDSRTAVTVSSETQCGGEWSCAEGHIRGSNGAWRAAYFLQFHPRGFDTALGTRFLIMHELGHLVDYEGLDHEHMAVFDKAFRASPAWRDCVTCVPMDEVFADQFAMWATGERASMTSYQTPQLLGPRQFQQLLAREYDYNIDYATSYQ